MIEKENVNNNKIKELVILNKEKEVNKKLEKVQKISLKLQNLCKIMIIILMVLLLSLIFIKSFYKTAYFPATYDNAIEKTDYKYDNLLENLAYIIGVLFIFYLLQTILNNIKLKYVIPIFLILIAGIFIWFVLTLKLVPIADQGQVMILGDAVYKNILNLMVHPGNYLEMFPYQFGYSLYMGIVINIINGLNNFLNLDIHMYLQILNCIYSIISMVLLYLIGNRLFKNNYAAKRNLMVLIFFFGIYFMFFNTHVYGNIPGLMFGLLSLLCTIRFLQDKKIYNIIITGISIFIAYYLKTNYQIFLIAIIGIIFLDFMKKFEIKKIISIIIILILFSLGKTIGNFIFEKYIDRPIPAGVPMVTYMYMGWAPGNSLSSGWYTGDVIELYNKNGFDHIATAEDSKDLFRKRIDYFLNEDFKEFLRYAWDKFDSTWLNPTFQTIWVSTPGSNRVDGDEKYSKYLDENSWIKEITSYDTKAFHIEERIFDAFTIIVFGCSIIGILKNRKENNVEFLLLAITFIGGLVFHFVVWETKSIYVLQYFYLILPYAAIGLEDVYEFIGEKVRKIRFGK